MAISTIGTKGLDQAADTILCGTSGNVGIGTTSPTQKLNVAGNLGLTNNNAYGWGDLTTYIAGDSSTDFVNVVTNSAERMRVDANGNVGIGTASPSASLDVLKPQGIIRVTSTTGTNTSYLATQNTGGFLYLGREDSAGGTFGTGTPYAGIIGLTGSYPLITTVNGAERMRIDSSGKLLLNTTSNPVGARINIYEPSNAGWAQSIVLGNTTNGTVYTNTSGTASYLAVGFYNNGASYTNAGAISVSGSTTTYSTSSDYRLKENVAPMIGALNVVQQLKPVTYNWKINGSSGQGFIAHELQEVCPDAVVGKKDDVDEDGNIKPQSIDTSFLVATLTAAIQELNAKVTELEAKLASK